MLFHAILVEILTKNYCNAGRYKKSIYFHNCRRRIFYLRENHIEIQFLKDYENQIRE